MQFQSYHTATTVAKVVQASTPLLLSAWSVTTTLVDWQKLPADVRERTLRAAQSLPFKDTPRSRWEAGRAAVAKGARRND